MERWARANYQPGIPLDGRDHRVTASREHAALAREAAAEGMVLLKNENNLLPIPAKTAVAVFGKAQIDYVPGGGGSGEVFAPYLISIYQGLSQKEKGGKLQLFHALAGFYQTEVLRQYTAGAMRGETTEPALPEDLLRRAREFSDFALITLCRYSEEGCDRAAKEFDGDYYLSKGETELVEKVCELFPKVAVVINAGSVIDTSWFCKNEKIQSALCVWQPGMEGGNAVADILCGDKTPSGKLCDTFAAHFMDYPSSEGFFDSDRYVNYPEDIYVGYRYFETFPDACDKVNYEFGYGLSYTTFSLSAPKAEINRDSVTVSVSVTNTGSRSGKEVVQLYYSAPQGKLGKPAKVLAAYQKTKLLAPGESQVLTLSFPVNAMASYDDTGKVTKSAYVLEAGTYRFFLGTSVRKGQFLAETLEISELQMVQQLTSRCAPRLLEKRLLADGSYETLETFPDEAAAGFVDENEESFNPPLCHCWPEAYDNEQRLFFKDVATGKATLDAFIAQLSDEQLLVMLGGQPNTGVANTFGIGGIMEYGIPNLMTSDGPAGVRIRPECGIPTTAWPCATLVACSFCPELAQTLGRAGAEELEENNLILWLTPGMNIHRSPLCGRNFEYYSEDPYLTSTIAAATVKGIQSRNAGATLKHFCCNNKETNRKECDSRVSERALREIYLKGFEIAIKEAKPLAIMTSYNRMNGLHTSEREDLLTGILREEWGFDGIVVSDWWNSANHLRELLAGNDIKMPVGDEKLLRAALADGRLTRRDMERSIRRILEFILKIQ